MSASEVPLRGKLEEHSFPAVLRALLNERRDGCLTIARGAITRRLYLRGGMIIYGSSTDSHDRLGEILVAQGKLTKADHKKYWEQSKAGNRLLGITLLVNDCITLSDLYQAVTAQVVTILDRLQKWRKGDYEFEEGRAPAAGTVLLSIPLALYLRTDTGLKATVKKPVTKMAAKTEETPVAPEPAAPAPAADQPPEASDPETEPTPPPPPSADDEQVLEIPTEPALADGISDVDAHEMDCFGEVSFMVQELRKRLGQGPFALLGVSPDAGHSAVQASYHRIAKVLHPDRISRGCTPELVHEADEIYREVTAAAQAAEEQLRHQADPGAADGATGAATTPATAPADQRLRPVLSEEDQSRRFFAQGREWISKRNYWQAADALRQAVRLKPTDATYRQYLGLTLMQTKRTQEAEEHLLEATRLEPNNPAHFVNLGRVYRLGRLHRKAREAFERALRIDPRNEHARDELSDLPDDHPPVRKSESGGLLKKLFGKG